MYTLYAYVETFVMRQLGSPAKICIFGDQMLDRYEQIYYSICTLALVVAGKKIRRGKWVSLFRSKADISL